MRATLDSVAGVAATYEVSSMFEKWFWKWHELYSMTYMGKDSRRVDVCMKCQAIRRWVDGVLDKNTFECPLHCVCNCEKKRR